MQKTTTIWKLYPAAGHCKKPTTIWKLCPAAGNCKTIWKLCPAAGHCMLKGHLIQRLLHLL